MKQAARQIAALAGALILLFALCRLPLTPSHTPPLARAPSPPPRATVTRGGAICPLG